MKKAVIIVAIVLIAVGLILFVGALLFGGNLKAKELSQKTYSIAEAFTGIRIETNLSDVQLVRSSDGACSVVTQEADKLTYSIGVQDGTLVIKSEDSRRWLDMLIPTRTNQVTVMLPSAAYAALSAKTETGDFSVPNNFTFDNIEIVCSTGDVQCAAQAAETLSIQTSTGDIALDGVSAASLKLSASTGDMQVNGAKIAGDVTVNVSTGMVTLTDVTCKNLRSEGSTGRVILKDVVADNELFLKRTTADVRFDACDAETITVHGGTGDVTGTLRSEKVFVCKASTGKVRVPDTQTGGKCEITVSTGDIIIEIAAPSNP